MDLTPEQDLRLLRALVEHIYDNYCYVKDEMEEMKKQIKVNENWRNRHRDLK